MTITNDDAVVEAVRLAYNKERNANADQWTAMSAALSVAVPLIEKQVIERCAGIADMHDHRGDIGKAIRSLGEGL